MDAKRKREPDWKPGTNNLTIAGRDKAHATIRRNARELQSIRHAYHFIKPLKEQGYSFGKIADMLNDEGYSTATGCRFHAIQVWNIMSRFAEKQEESK